MLTDVKTLRNADLEKKYFCCIFAQRLKEGYAAPPFFMTFLLKTCSKEGNFSF